MKKLILLVTVAGLSLNCQSKAKTEPAKDNAAQQPATGQNPQVSGGIDWSKAGTASGGLQVYNLGGVQVQVEGTATPLTDFLNTKGKAKAVLQVIDYLPGGGFCGGCVAKADAINDEMKTANLSDTTYVMILSGANYTPSSEDVTSVKSSLTNPLLIVRDINGAFQKKFGPGVESPVTLVLNHHNQGKLFDMHVGQPVEVISALKEIPAN
jgi:hypothetical protein